jgi:hypothetical protein
MQIQTWSVLARTILLQVVHSAVLGTLGGLHTTVCGSTPAIQFVDTDSGVCLLAETTLTANINADEIQQKYQFSKVQ